MDWLWTTLLTGLGLSGLGLAAGFLLLGGGFATELAKGVNLMLGALAPAVGALFSRLVAGVIWVWDHILWPGLHDILDSWVTILTVLLMGWVLWEAIRFSYEARLENRQAAINECYAELAKAKKKVSAPSSQPAAPRFPLPWDGLFGR